MMPNLRCMVTQGQRSIGSRHHFCSKPTEPPVNPASKEAEMYETLGYALYRGFALTRGYVFGFVFIGDRLRQTGLRWQEGRRSAGSRRNFCSKPTEQPVYPGYNVFRTWGTIGFLGCFLREFYLLCQFCKENLPEDFRVPRDLLLGYPLKIKGYYDN